MKAKLIFIGMKQIFYFFEKNKNPKLSFSSSTNIQFTILEQFIKFKACKSGEIDTIGIEVTQHIKLSSCLTKGHFSAKNTFLAHLALTNFTTTNFSGLLLLQMIWKNCLFTSTLMLMVKRKSVPLALFWHYHFHWAQQFCFWEHYLFYSLNVILSSQTGGNTQGTVYILEQ